MSVPRSGLLHVAAWVLLIGSLGPAAFFLSDGTNVSGLGALLFGWSAVLTGVVGWCANLVGPVTAILLLKKKRLAALVSASIGLALALSSLMMLGRVMPNVNINTYNWVKVTEVPVTAMGPAFYLWLGSQVALLLACLALPQPEAQSP